MFRCRVERDSITHDGKNRLLSFVIQFPRVVLAEVATHRLNYDTWGPCEASWCERTADRDTSKNSASSRAIPLWRMLKSVLEDPYVPERFSAAGKGMQGSGWLDDEDNVVMSERWLDARNAALIFAMSMLNEGDREVCFEKVPWLEQYRHLVKRHPAPTVSVHKQDVNRLLEPWAWVTQIVTSSRWDNYWALRCDKAAHPAFSRIARMTYLAARASAPKRLVYGQWHLPFVPPDQAEAFSWCPNMEWVKGEGFVQLKEDFPDLIKFSAARCAWVSYNNADSDGSPEKMLGTWNTLVGGTLKHSSPCEHQATPITSFLRHRTLQSNLEGWLQARKLLPDECVDHYAPTEEEITSWGITGPLWPEPTLKE